MEKFVSKLSLSSFSFIFPLLFSSRRFFHEKKDLIDKVIKLYDPKNISVDFKITLFKVIDIIVKEYHHERNNERITENERIKDKNLENYENYKDNNGSINANHAKEFIELKFLKLMLHNGNAPFLLLKSKDILLGSGNANHFDYSALIFYFGKLLMKDDAQKLYDRGIEIFGQTHRLQESFLYALSKSGMHENVQKVFNAMTNTTIKHYNQLIESFVVDIVKKVKLLRKGAFVQSGNPFERYLKQQTLEWEFNINPIFDLYKEIVKKNLIPDNYTFAILLRLASALENFNLLEFLLEEMKFYNISNDEYIVSLIANVHVKCERLDLAERIIEEFTMIPSLSHSPISLSLKITTRNPMIFRPLLEAYSRKGNVKNAIRIMNWMKFNGISIGFHEYSILFTMYLRLSRLDDALKIKKEMINLKGIIPHISNYNLLLLYYLERGMEGEFIKVEEEIKTFKLENDNHTNVILSKFYSQTCPNSDKIMKLYERLINSNHEFMNSELVSFLEAALKLDLNELMKEILIKCNEQDSKGREEIHNGNIDKNGKDYIKKLQYERVLFQVFDRLDLLDQAMEYLGKNSQLEDDVVPYNITLKMLLKSKKHDSINDAHEDDEKCYYHKSVDEIELLMNKNLIKKDLTTEILLAQLNQKRIERISGEGEKLGMIKSEKEIKWIKWENDKRDIIKFPSSFLITSSWPKICHLSNLLDTSKYEELIKQFEIMNDHPDISLYNLYIKTAIRANLSFDYKKFLTNTLDNFSLFPNIRTMNLILEYLFRINDHGSFESVLKMLKDYDIQKNEMTDMIRFKYKLLNGLIEDAFGIFDNLLFPLHKRLKEKERLYLDTSLVGCLLRHSQGNRDLFEQKALALMMNEKLKKNKIIQNMWIKFYLRRRYNDKFLKDRIEELFEMNDMIMPLSSQISQYL